jgi:enoyl-CoA hydratase
MSAFEARNYIDGVHKCLFAVEDNHKPTIAAVRGLALGGGQETAMACDIRIFADNCTLGLPEINVGILSWRRRNQRMPRNTSIAIAKQYILTGDFFDSATAYRIGLANKWSRLMKLWMQLKKMARKKAKKSPLALREAKNAVTMSMN